MSAHELVDIIDENNNVIETVPLDFPFITETARSAFRSSYRKFAECISINTSNDTATEERIMCLPF